MVSGLEGSPGLVGLNVCLNSEAIAIIKNEKVNAEVFCLILFDLLSRLWTYLRISSQRLGVMRGVTTTYPSRPSLSHSRSCSSELPSIH
jgi:hypothetical protein